MTDIEDEDIYSDEDLIDDDEDIEEFLPDKGKEKTILSDLQKYGISEDVAILADSIYRKESTKVFRQKNRIFLLFYYTLLAYRELYKDVDPFRISKCFNMTQGQVVKSVNNFNKKRNVSMISFTNPICLLKGYCSELGISIEEDMVKEIISKKPTILNTCAQTLAAGIVYYYSIVYNEKIDMAKLELISTRSLTTIKKAANDIGLIDNS